MAELKFRIYYEEDESIYRDVVIKHTQKFIDLHNAILKAYGFDNKHQATFFRSNDNWQRGREISLEKYDKVYKVDPLLMGETLLGEEIKIPNQKFIYIYDFNKEWTFLIELIKVQKSSDPKVDYPSVVRTEGIAPPQYGTKGMFSDKFTEIEEKYDLGSEERAEGFGEEGEDGGEGGNEDEGAEDFGDDSGEE